MAFVRLQFVCCRRRSVGKECFLFVCEVVRREYTLYIVYCGVLWPCFKRCLCGCGAVLRESNIFICLYDFMTLIQMPFLSLWSFLESYHRHPDSDSWPTNRYVEQTDTELEHIHMCLANTFMCQVHTHMFQATCVYFFWERISLTKPWRWHVAQTARNWYFRWLSVIPFAWGGCFKEKCKRVNW